MIKKFKISEIDAGWITFGVGDHLYTISYLSDFKERFDYLFNLKNYEAKTITLDMESQGDLCIHAILEYEILYLTLFKMHEDRIKTVTYRCDYPLLIDSYLREMECNKQSYLIDFNMPHEDDEPYEWNNDNYVALNKI